LVEAYVVEGQSLEGSSGSPVFVRRSFDAWIQPPNSPEPVWATLEGSIWCLGLQSDAFISDQFKNASGGVIPRGANVVVPSQKIIEVLNHAMVGKKQSPAASKSKRAHPSHTEDDSLGGVA
jgi:hypothetical protein